MGPHTSYFLHWEFSGTWEWNPISPSCPLRMIVQIPPSLPVIFCIWGEMKTPQLTPGSPHSACPSSRSGETGAGPDSKGPRELPKELACPDGGGQISSWALGLSGMHTHTYITHVHAHTCAQIQGGGHRQLGMLTPRATCPSPRPRGGGVINI